MRIKIKMSLFFIDYLFLLQKSRVPSELSHLVDGMFSSSTMYLHIIKESFHV